jgi:hypothetical protein
LVSPRIKSRYYNRSTARSLWRQYYQYGFWKVRVMQKHPGQMKLRHFAPPGLAAALISTAALAPFSRLSRVGFALVAGAYGLANLGASGWIARKAGWAHLPRLSGVFAILHLGYGLGFLVGLVKFRDRFAIGRHDGTAETQRRRDYECIE